MVKEMVVLGGVVCLLFFLLAPSHSAPTPRPPRLSSTPNIIFILADDLGYGDVGTYWNNNTHGRIQTPYLNWMSSQGTRWTQFYAGDTVCAPSRCSLMTGVHTGHARIRGNSPSYHLLEEDVTIPMVLKKANYNTGIIGKWGLGDEGSPGIPTKKGFDRWFGYLDQLLAHDYYPETLWNQETRDTIIGNVPGSYTNYSHDLFANLAIDWITEQANKPNPFFLYLAFTIPHAGGIGTVDETGEPVPSPDPYQHEDWPQVEIDFAAMITRMDKSIGNVFALLTELGIDEETIVFFASDNGAHNEGGHDYLFFDSSGPLQGFKRSMHDGGIRAPLIVRWPGVVPAGKVDETSVFAFWDILPTLADFAGVPASSLPPGLDGVSKMPTILGKPQEMSDYLYWEFCCYQEFRQAVRVGDWKGVRWSVNSTLQLYNITADIGEQNDISAYNPDVVAKLEQLLIDVREESDVFPSDPCNAGC